MRIRSVRALRQLHDCALVQKVDDGQVVAVDLVDRVVRSRRLTGIGELEIGSIDPRHIGAGSAELVQDLRAGLTLVQSLGFVAANVVDAPATITTAEGR